MPVRAFLHYALEVPDQLVGQKYYQDFGLVDATGNGDAVRLRAARQERETCCSTRARASGSITCAMEPPARTSVPRRRLASRGRREGGRPAAGRPGGRDLDPRPGRQLGERARGGRARASRRLAPLAQRARLHAEAGRPRIARARLPRDAAPARPRVALHPRRRPPDRLLHPRARAQALGPLGQRHRVPPLQHRPPHAGPAGLAGSRLSPRVLPGGQRRRDRDGRAARWPTAAGSPAGGSDAT